MNHHDETVAASNLIALPDCGPTPLGARSLLPPPQSGHLYVIFHGLFCFFPQGRSILVRVPRMCMSYMSPCSPPMPAHSCGSPPDMGGSYMGGMDHVYTAGTWLGEQAYQPDCYE